MNPTDRFYFVCAQGLRSAQLGQYADNSPLALRANLEQEAKAFDTNWGPKSGTIFTMISPGVDVMNTYIDQACNKLQKWIDAGKPALQ